MLLYTIPLIGTNSSSTLKSILALITTCLPNCSAVAETVSIQYPTSFVTVVFSAGAGSPSSGSAANASKPATEANAPATLRQRAIERISLPFFFLKQRTASTSDAATTKITATAIVPSPVLGESTGVDVVVVAGVVAAVVLEAVDTVEGLLLS